MAPWPIRPRGTLGPEDRLLDPVTQYRYLCADAQHKSTGQGGGADEGESPDFSTLAALSSPPSQVADGSRGDVNASSHSACVTCPISHTSTSSASVASTSSIKKPLPRIISDTKRCWFPGQVVEATLDIPASLIGPGSGVWGIDVQVEGIIHTFRHIRYDGGRHNMREKQSIFSYRSRVWPPLNLPSTDQDADASTLRTEPKWGEILCRPGVSDDGHSTWRVSARLPKYLVVGKGQRLTLPPSFKDSYRLPRDGSVRVMYAWKLTCHRTALLARKISIVSPFMVQPFAVEAPFPEMMVLPSGRNVTANDEELPLGWTRSTCSSDLSKNLVVGRGHVEIALACPRPGVAPQTDKMPFLLTATVRAKTAQELLEGPASCLPSLPSLVGGGSTPTSPSGPGPPGSEAKFSGGPQLCLRRRVEQMPHRVSMQVSAPNFEETSFRLRVTWTKGHLSPLCSASESAALEEDAAPLYGSSGGVDTPGHGWTSPKLDLGSSSGATASKYPWSTTVTLAGHFDHSATPAFAVPRLQVSYRLQVQWPVKGLGNSISQDLCDWRPTSGVLEEEMESGFLSDVEATRRVAGSRYPLMGVRLGAKGSLNSTSGSWASAPGGNELLPTYCDLEMDDSRLTDEGREPDESQTTAAAESTTTSSSRLSLFARLRGRRREQQPAQSQSQSESQWTAPDRRTSQATTSTAHTTTNAATSGNVTTEELPDYLETTGIR